MTFEKLLKLCSSRRSFCIACLPAPVASSSPPSPSPSAAATSSSQHHYNHPANLTSSALYLPATFACLDLIPPWFCSEHRHISLPLVCPYSITSLALAQASSSCLSPCITFLSPGSAFLALFRTQVRIILSSLFLHPQVRASGLRPATFRALRSRSEHDEQRRRRRMV